MVRAKHPNPRDIGRIRADQNPRCLQRGPKSLFASPARWALATLPCSHELRMGHVADVGNHLHAQVSLEFINHRRQRQREDGVDVIRLDDRWDVLTKAWSAYTPLHTPLFELACQSDPGLG